MIVVFGSINVDMVMAVPTLPRPGETVLAPGYRLVPGGKGANQALAAARGGAAVSMVGSVGRDGFAEVALSLLRAAGIDLSRVAPCDAATGCAIVCVDPGGENQIAVASGANLATRADQVADAMLGPDTTVLMQCEVAADETASLIARARARGARIVLNAAPAAPLAAATLDALDVMVVNRIEAEMLGAAAADPLAAARSLAAAHRLAAIVTLGGDGAVAATAEAAWRIGALAVRPVDTTGAGDAFVGVLAAALDRGDDLSAALRRASVGAALACLVEGAQPGIPDEAAIAARLEELPPARPVGTGSVR